VIRVGYDDVHGAADALIAMLRLPAPVAPPKPEHAP
jgi:hypothetical protein